MTFDYNKKLKAKIFFIIDGQNFRRSQISAQCKLSLTALALALALTCSILQCIRPTRCANARLVFTISTTLSLEAKTHVESGSHSASNLEAKFDHNERALNETFIQSSEHLVDR